MEKVMPEFKPGTIWESVGNEHYISLYGNEVSGWTAYLEGEFDIVPVGVGRTKQEACVGAVEYLRKVAEAFESMERKL
jgi:hypothetical protein